MVAVWFGSFTGSAPLFDVDEGAFTEATREMFVRGDFLSTYLHGVPRYDKPILFYWLQALSIQGFGFNEVAYRLPSVLAATAWCFAVYWFVRRWYRNSAYAILAAAVLATSLHIGIIAKAATADALLNALLAAAMLNWFLYFETASRNALYAVAVFTGLGVLTKGPIALLVPVAVGFFYAGSQRNLSRWLMSWIDPRAVSLFCMIALPWFVADFLTNGGGFLKGFLWTHNIGRFQARMEGHGGPFWYYLPVTLLALLPYSGLLPMVVARCRLLWDQPFERFALIWFGFVFILFSLSATKLPHYLIYGYTGLLIVLTGFLRGVSASGWSHVPTAVFFAAAGSVPLLLAGTAPGIGDPYTRAVFESFSAPNGLYVFSAVGLLLVIYFWVKPSGSTSWRTVAMGAVLSLVVSCGLMPGLIRAYQTPIVTAAAIARDRPENVVFWKLHMPSFSVYSGRVGEKRMPHSGELALTKTKHAGGLPPHDVVYEAQGITLARVR